MQRNYLLLLSMLLLSSCDYYFTRPEPTAEKVPVIECKLYQYMIDVDQETRAPLTITFIYYRKKPQMHCEAVVGENPAIDSGLTIIQRNDISTCTLDFKKLNWSLQFAIDVDNGEAKVDIFRTDDNESEAIYSDLALHCSDVEL